MLPPLPHSPKMNKPRILTASVAACLILPSVAFAAERNWIGGGVAGDWNDPANWDNGVPTTDTSDNIYVRLADTLTGPAINAGVLRIAVGSPTVTTSGFSFGLGTHNYSEIQVADAHNGLNPKNNLYGRAFINAGTTINTGQFFVGEWEGGTGHVVQAGGDVVISGQFRVGHWPQTQVAGGGLTSTYTLNGGTITLTGDPANPFDENTVSGAGNVFLGIDSTGVLTVNGGVFTAKGIAFDNRGGTPGEDTLEINGGTVNIGANGLVSNENAGTPDTYEIKLGGGTLRATASWTSNLETTLVSGGSGIIYDTNNNIVTLSGALKGTGGLTKIGAGSLILTNDNTYAGSTTISAGGVEIGNGGTTGSLGAGSVSLAAGTTLAYKRTNTLIIPGQVTGSGSISVESGTLLLANANSSVTTTVAATATFGGLGTVGSITLSPGATLQAAGSASGALSTPSVTFAGNTLKLLVGSTSTRLVVTNAGGLVANGANTIQIEALGLTPGTYPLIDYSGTIGGTGANTFTLVGLPARAIGSMVHNVANTSIDLNITAIDFPKWTGASSGVWDGVALNWQLITAGTATNYQNLDAVLFDDSAAGTTTIDVGSAFTPSAVTFNNPTKTYTLNGTGGLAGTTGLIKQGAGRVVLATTNTYTGPTSVQAGVLQIGDGVAGSLAGTSVTIAAGASVELNLTAPYTAPTTGAGTLKSIGDGVFDIAADVISGNMPVNVAGTSTHILSMGSQRFYTGPITISGGTLTALGTQALGTADGNTTITQGGTLNVNSLDLGSEQVLVAGTGADGLGAIVNNGADSYGNLRRITLTGPTSFGGTGRWDIRSNGSPNQLLDLGGFKLTKVGFSQVSVVDIDITPGDIDVNEGTFSIESNANVGGAGTITLNGNGTLGLWVNQPNRLTRNIVAAGGFIRELGSDSTSTVNSPISLQANLEVYVNEGGTAENPTTLILAGNITQAPGEARTFFANGPGRLVLTGTNQWTGGTTVRDGGILLIGNGDITGSIGTGPISVEGGGRLVPARTDGYTFTDDINELGPSGQLILTAGGTVKLGAGVDVKVNQLHFGVNGQNDTVGGTLEIANGNTIAVQEAFIVGNSNGGGGTVMGVINQTGGSLDVNVPNTDGRNFVIGHWGQGQGFYNQSGGTLNSPGISMAVSWDGSGEYNLSGGTANVLGLRFGHNGAQTGVFNLTGGTLNLGSEGIWEQFTGLPNDINLGGGTIVAAADTNIFLPADLTGTNGNTTFNTNGNTLTIPGPLAGSGGLVKTGAGTLVLTAANSQTGSTAVNAGTLRVNNTAGSATGSGNVTIAAGARLGGSGTIGDGVGAITATLNGKLAPGNSAGTLTFNLGTGKLDITGAITLTGTAALEFELGATSDLVKFTSGGLTIGTGLLEIDDFLFTGLAGLAEGDYVLFDSDTPITGTLGANLTGVIAPGFTGTLQFADGTNDLLLHVVPEPGSVSALIAGLGMLLGFRRSRKAT